jgi:hypothetical protein
MRSDTSPSPALTPGAELARGVCRCLASMDFAPLVEFVPARGLRVDVMALGPGGEVWVIECKSSRADFQSDQKWQGYLDWCDRFFWAVSPDFPTELLPEDAGLFLGDSYGAELMRMAPEARLAPARRKALTRAFARQSAWRLQRQMDPAAMSVGG